MRTSTVPARGPGSLAEHHDLTRRLELHVRALARPRHRVAQPLANQQTRERVCDLLSAWGYEVGLQGPYHNVVATPAGASGPLPAVCAHCDSVPCTPGADDNASALAVMLEVARAAAAGGAPVAAISFNGEEDDLAGSRDFAAHGHAGDPGLRVHDAGGPAARRGYDGVKVVGAEGGSETYTGSKKVSPFSAISLSSLGGVKRSPQEAASASSLLTTSGMPMRSR